MYKLSNFNNFIEEDGCMLIYNTFSSAVLKLNNHCKNQIMIYKNTNKFEDLSDELIENLKKGNMLIDENFDEVKYLNVINKMSRYQSDFLSLTIAPTLECNFACPYCYESGRRFNTMSDEVFIKTCEFIEERAVNKLLGVCWYGGEPLLSLDVIEEFSKVFIDKYSQYESSMVTNGYLLSKQVAEKLKLLKIKNIQNIQITIDGPPDTHNKTRVLRNNNGSFDRILQNVIDCCDIIPITIRVNVDYNSIERVDELLDIFDSYQLQNRIGVYLAPVTNINGELNYSACMSNVDYSESVMRYYTKNWNRGYFKVETPYQNTSNCGAVSLNSFVIDPLGDLYKCWNDVGNTEYKVGSIFKGPTLNNYHLKWLDHQSVYVDECKECKALPICMGGCPDFVVKGKNRDCHTIKYNSNEYIKLLADIKQRV